MSADQLYHSACSSTASYPLDSSPAFHVLCNSFVPNSPSLLHDLPSGPGLPSRVSNSPPNPQSLSLSPDAVEMVAEIRERPVESTGYIPMG
jgi:hypothetical protein